MFGNRILKCLRYRKARVPHGIKIPKKFRRVRIGLDSIDQGVSRTDRQTDKQMTRPGTAICEGAIYCLSPSYQDVNTSSLLVVASVSADKLRRTFVGLCCCCHV